MRFLALSLAIHILVFALLAKPTPVAAPGLAFDLITTARPRERAPSRPIKKIELGDLGFQGQLGLHGQTGARERTTQASDPRFGLGGGGGARMMAESRDTSVFQELYRRIDANVTYPSELRQQGIEGVVTAQLAFSREGKFLKEQSTVENGASNYLRVVVARALRKAMADELPETMKKNLTAPFTLDCTFRFEFTEGDAAALKAANKLIAGNSLFFYRNFHHSRLQWEVGPLSGLLPVPALGINPAWFAEKVAGLFSNKSKVDPLQPYRDDPEW